MTVVMSILVSEIITPAALDTTCCDTSKNPHNDVKGVSDNHHSYKCFENPFKEHERFNIMKIIFFNDHLYQFVAHHKGQDNAGNGDNHGFG